MLLRALSQLVEGLLLVMMVVLCADVFLGVFSRYVIGRTFTWYDEIARLLFVWIVFLGAAVGVRRTAHFRLHLVIDRLGPAGRRLAHAVGVLVLI
ncbi:MAG TPA: TRAP transporter small permease subunit, partial [Methylomirabilota bacterium]